MFINPISAVNPVKNPSAVNNKSINFTGKSQVCSSVKELSNYTFSASEPMQNAKKLKKITDKLLGSINDIHNNNIRSMYAKCHGKIKPLVKRLHELREKLNVNPFQYYRFLSDSPEKFYVSLHNLGKYEDSNVEQIVLQFKNPNTGEFIGLSNDADDNLAITTNNNRHEFYYNSEDSCPYKGLAEGTYIPNQYLDYFDRDGNSIRKNTSFWDWLFG